MLAGEILRIDVDAGRFGVIGPAQLLHVVVVAGLLGGHEACHELGKLVLVHVHLEGVGERGLVDAHGARHVASKPGHIRVHRGGHLLLHRARELGHHLRHGALHIRLHGGTELRLQLRGDGLRQRREQLLLNLLADLLRKLIAQLLFDLTRHAAKVDGAGDDLLHGGLRGGVCQIRRHGRIDVARVFRVRRQPRGVPLHDAHDAGGERIGFNGWLHTVEADVQPAEVKVQLAYVDGARVDADGGRIEGRQAGKIQAHARQIHAGAQIGSLQPRGQRALVEREGALQLLPVDGEQA